MNMTNEMLRNRNLEIRIAEELSSLKIIAPEILYYNSVLSTMDVAWDIINKGTPLDGTVIIAGQQTEGRGRYKRKWHSPDGGVWLSVISYYNSGSALLSFVAGIAGCETVREYLPGASIKWVNDVIYNGKKLCGVLVESKCNYSVIGIGINTNITEFPDELEGNATSVKIETGMDVDNVEFVKTLLQRFDRHYQNFKNGCYGEIVDCYKLLTSSLGRELRVMHGNNSFTASAVDIDETGALVVFSEEKGRQRIIDGELTYL